MLHVTIIIVVVLFGYFKNIRRTIRRRHLKGTRWGYSIMFGRVSITVTNAHKMTSLMLDNESVHAAIVDVDIFRGCLQVN